MIESLLLVIIFILFVYLSTNKSTVSLWHMMNNAVNYIIEFITYVLGSVIDEDTVKIMSESPLHFHGNKRSIFGIPCINCFPNAALSEASSPRYYHGVENKYIDLLEFPKFNGFKGLSKLDSYDTRELSFPWFADIIYTLKTPLPHKYNSVYNFVLESRR